MVAINTKERMYKLLWSGRFGNYPRAWKSIEEVIQSGFRGEVSLRSMQINNPVRLYHIQPDKLEEVVQALPISQRAAGLTFTEAPPDHKRVIQGEYDGESLTYSFSPKPMRFALAEAGLHARGFAARRILQAYMEPGDYEWICDLLVDFPGATVEFSTFSVPVGTQPGSKMIVWEVRHY
jgi:hypothetical protein